MRKRSLLFTLIVMLFLLTGCSFGGKAPDIKLDGAEVNLGKTKISELKGAGFENKMSHIDKKNIGSMSWENFYALKDGKSYGTMYAANMGNGEITFDNGVVIKIFISYDDPDYETGDVLINGVNFAGYTKDQVKEAMADFEMTLDSEEYLDFESGKYGYSFSFAEGSDTVTQIVIDEGTETELTIQ